jgi:L-aminopeptidase/D-esterase-like protein
MFGPMIRSYLPQTWVFTTEEGSASLTVDTDGRANATAGILPKANVTVETTHARLEAALRTRRKEAVPAGPLTVTPHTEKGRTAFGLLRGRLGL